MTNDSLRRREAKMAPLAGLGWMLAGLSILALLLVLHHPAAHGRTVADVLASMRAQTGVDQGVHGGLAIIFGLLTAAMLVFASRLGAWRIAVVLGSVAYASAFVLLVIAVMNDGFIVPAIANGCAVGSPPACASQALTLLKWTSLQIEFATRFAMVAIAIAIAAWSIALFATRGVPLWAGVAGLVAGMLQLASLAASPAHLTAHGLVWVMVGQVGWYVIVAALMIGAWGPFGAGSQIGPSETPA